VAGTPFNATVKVIDKNGATVPNFTGNVVFFSSDSRSSINGQTVNFSPFDQGTKIVSLPTLITAGVSFVGAYAVIIPPTFPPVPPGLVNGVQTGINVVPAAPTNITITHSLTIITAGQTIEPFTVSLKDVYDNPVNQVNVEIDVVQQDRTTIIQTETFNANSDITGKAYTDLITVLDKTTTVTITAILPDYPAIPAATKTFSVKGNITVNISLNNSVVQAGDPVGCVLTVFNPDGTIATDFEGIVYVFGYAYSYMESGTRTTYTVDQYGNRVNPIIIPIEFTEADSGEKTITDIFSFIYAGIQYVADGAGTSQCKRRPAQKHHRYAGYYG